MRVSNIYYDDRSDLFIICVNFKCINTNDYKIEIVG